ncbi:MAG: tRNA (adenine(22)-N(1))-methyltransferase TrmK [Streptococcaceae bacterium]|jgi:tRNA (adenine22-N1)-methyltransferase|nr:tRNA (adenine(22)-N(1))-methyltransferase TrmK [Streptococcaceae bacterium]
MNEIQLSKRLEKIASYIPKKTRLADIGSDHAYLPIFCMLTGKISYAIASEVIEGPFEKTLAQVDKNDLKSYIEVRLGNGLEAIFLDDEIDVITIAGMGGILIAEILEMGLQKKRLNGKERLILQPNIGESYVRYWLMNNDYQIFVEDIFEEKQKIYEIIVAQKGIAYYSEQELFFGPFLIEEKKEVFYKKWECELINRRKILNSLEKATIPNQKKEEVLQKEINWIKKVLKK